MMNIPDYWQQKIQEYLETKRKELPDVHRLYIEQNLSGHIFTAYDTNDIILLLHEDGTFCLFRYAFYILDVEKQEILICTEHNGSHIFPFYQSDNIIMTLTFDEWREFSKVDFVRKTKKLFEDLDLNENND